MEQTHSKPSVASREDRHNWGSLSVPPHERIQLEPEKRLLLAVLADAVKCIQETQTSLKRKKLAEAATEWMLSNKREHPFCFQELCHALDWDPQQIRESVVKSV